MIIEIIKEKNMNKLNTCILFIDDVKENCEVFLSLFEQEKDKIFTAVNFEIADKILKENPEKIGLITADYKISDNISGLEFFKKCSVTYPNIIRILTTGYIDNHLLKNALTSGLIYKCILKPWRQNEFEQTIYEACERFALQKKQA